MKHDFSCFKFSKLAHGKSLQIFHKYLKKYCMFMRLSLIIILLKPLTFLVQLIFEGEVFKSPTISVDSAISPSGSMFFFLFYVLEAILLGK